MDVDIYFGSENLFRVLQAAVQKAEFFRVSVSVCITDASGLSLAFLRMNGARLASIELATKKAYTAVMLKMPTKDLSAIAQPGTSFFQLEGMLGGRIVTCVGGIPLFCNNQLIGAVGVSGGGEEDHKIAQAAVDAFHGNSR